MVMLIFMIFVASSYFNLRSTDLIATLVVSSLTIRKARTSAKKLFISNVSISSLLLLILAVSATFLAWLNQDKIDSAQLVRGNIPLLFFLFQISLLSNSFLATKVFLSVGCKALLLSIEYFIYFLAFTFILGLLASIQLMPGIYVANSLRVFPPLSSIIIPISLLAYFQNKFSLLFACAVLLLASQSRSHLIVFILSILVLTIKPAKLLLFRQLLLSKKTVFILVGITLTLVFAYLNFGTRFEQLFQDGGDPTRRLASSLAVDSLKDATHLLLGIGMGVPHSIGYYTHVAILQGSESSLQLQGDAFQRLLENSKYDIEQFYTYIQVRHGILGAVSILWIIYHAFKTKLVLILFLLYILVNGFGGSLINTQSSAVFVTIYLYFDWLVLNSRK